MRQGRAALLAVKGTSGGGGELRAHFTETSELQACGLWAPGVSWQGGRAGGASFTQCGRSAWDAPAGGAHTGWKLRWSCLTSQTLGKLRLQGILGSRGVAALLRETAKGRVGHAQQRPSGLASLLGHASLPSILPTTLFGVSVAPPTTGTK